MNDTLITATATAKKPSLEKPWLKFFSEEAKNAALEKETIYENLLKKNKDYRDDIALNYFGNRISYGKLLDSIDAGAASFSALGVGEGDYVCCLSVTTPEVVYTLYSLNKIGAAMIALDPRRSAPEIRHFVEASKSKAIVVIDLAYEHVMKAIEGLDVKRVIVISPDTSMPFMVRTVKNIKMPSPKIPYGGNVVNWKTFVKEGVGTEAKPVPYKKDATAAITLTGGTTGSPKGVMLSNEGFNAVALDFGNCGVSYTRDQRFLNIIPTFTSYGIVSSLHMPLSLGLELVLIPKFDPDKVGYYIKKYRPAHTLLVPTYYEKLMYSKEMKNGFDLSFFETAGSGGDTMNVGLETKLNNFLAEHGCKFPLSQGYGMSEASSAVSCCCNGNFKSMSVGYPLLMNTIGIFKPDTTEELDYNEEGEICITGPAVMLGYFNNKEEDEKVLIKHPDGKVWVHSGDLGTMDEEGYLYIKGRIKRVIPRADGHKVFPSHIEDVISTHNGVFTCAVVGVRDREHTQGMNPLAVVEAKTNRVKEELYAELNELINKELEARGRPCDIIFVDSMPHTSMGKIDYQKLADDYEAEMDKKFK